MAVLQRDRPLQPVPLHPGGRRPHQRLRARRRRRGAVHLGGGRRLRPRGDRAAQGAGHWLRRPLRGHDPRRGRGHRARRSPTSPCRPTLALAPGASPTRSRSTAAPAIAARPATQDEPVGAGAAQPAGGSRFISREHYLMWRPAALGPYVRAGRFFAPFGLRLAEHYAYVRRDLGYNLLEESLQRLARLGEEQLGAAPDRLRSRRGPLPRAAPSAAAPAWSRCGWATPPRWACKAGWA